MSEEPDEIKAFRQLMAADIDAHPKTKEDAEKEFGKDDVWDEEGLQRDFDVHAQLPPCCFVVRKSDGVPGILGFQDKPRLYFKFINTEDGCLE